MSQEQLTQALNDAATSLETISRLAGKPVHPDGTPTYLDSFPDVRSYAKSRAAVARAALSATQPAQVAQGEPTLRDYAADLVDAGHDFWKACEREAGGGAVRWLSCDDGTLIVFTRVEYRDEIMAHVRGYKAPVVVFDEDGMTALEAEAAQGEPVRELKSALNGMLTFFGMDDDADSKPVFDKARKALNLQAYKSVPKVLKKPYMYHHKMTDIDSAFADGWNACRKAVLSADAVPDAPKGDLVSVDRSMADAWLSSMERVIDVADRSTDEFDALRKSIIDLTMTLHALQHSPQ